jgi:hypothetical protein
MTLAEIRFSQSRKLMSGNATPIVETPEASAINFRESY